MNQDDNCPFTGCPLEKTGGCVPEYREQCEHQAKVILEFHKERLKNEDSARLAQRQSEDL